MKDTQRVLHRLPEVKAALAAGRTIFVAEGEKDCDALAKAGFAATCNAMGAGKWLPEHSQTLLGAARAVVIADKDTPGRKHAQSVAASLGGVVRCVRLLESPDRDGKPVKDSFDFFAAGGTADELRGLVKAASEFVPAVEPQATKSGSAASEYLAPGDRTGDAAPDETGRVKTQTSLRKSLINFRKSLKNDPTMAFSEFSHSLEKSLQRLAALPPLEFDRCAEVEADALGVTVGTLRKKVAKRRPKRDNSLQGTAVELPDVELWPEAVAGAEVLDEVAESFRRYVVSPDGAADALAGPMLDRRRTLAGVFAD